VGRQAFYDRLSGQLAEIEAAGLTKEERVLTSPQGIWVEVAGRSEPVLNLCANNYLGLANHPQVLEAARAALDEYGFGLSSVRFICGTQGPHRALERDLSDFLGMEETLLYGSCFDANGGLFEPLLDGCDAIVSDEFNHASIIDGVRLCKAQRYRYGNNDMADLRRQLMAARRGGARDILIVTDGVFSMDGYLVNLPELCALAEEFGSLTVVDDSHATGVVGPQGRGTAAHFGMTERVDIVTSTLGKALGGGSGGFTSGRREVIQMLRQRSRPYLFSNAPLPVAVASAHAALRLTRDSSELREKLQQNTYFFREGMAQAGFDLLPGEHPIVPVMVGDAAKAAALAAKLLEHGIYVIAFSFPVVPKGSARIRCQITAAHCRAELEMAIEAFKAARAELEG